MRVTCVAVPRSGRTSWLPKLDTATRLDRLIRTIVLLFVHTSSPQDNRARAHCYLRQAVYMWDRSPEPPDQWLSSLQSKQLLSGSRMSSRMLDSAIYRDADLGDAPVLSIFSAYLLLFPRLASRSLFVRLGAHHRPSSRKPSPGSASTRIRFGNAC